VDFYAFQDQFMSPTRQNYYLVSFKDEQLIRVVLAETRLYSQAAGIQKVREALRQRSVAHKTDTDPSDPERRHLLLSVQQEACAHLWAGAVEGVAWETAEAKGWRTNRAGSDLSEDCWRDRGKTVALPPNMGCVEGFGAILELVSYQFFQDWNVSSPGVDLPAVTSVTPDTEYYTAVVFSQPGVDSQGQTQLTVNFHLRGPTGQEVIQPVLEAECWNGKPAPIGRELGLCLQHIKLPVDRLTDEGDYIVEAIVKDYFKNVQVRLTKLVTFHR